MAHCMRSVHIESLTGRAILSSRISETSKQHTGYFSLLRIFLFISIRLKFCELETESPNYLML